MRQRKDAICNIQISDDPVFGVHFTYNVELCHNENFFEKLGSLKKMLRVWFRRDLSIYGRMNTVKTLALFKLVFISPGMETQKKTLQQRSIKLCSTLSGTKNLPPPQKKDNAYQEEIGWWS